MQYAFLFDQSRCVGCKTCLVACKDWNGINPGKVHWRKHTETVSGVMPVFGELKHGDVSEFSLYNMVISCNHCTDPACVKNCGMGAIVKDPGSGMVIIDREKCIGLRTCEDACPYGAISHVDENSTQETTDPKWAVAHPAQKCTMCFDRAAVGKLPVCVSSCRERALDFGTTEYLKVKYGSRMALEAPGFVRENTQPNIYFIKKENRK